MTNVGQLSFSFNIGGCTKTSQEQIYLCFPEKDYKTCWTAERPTGKFEKVNESLFDHKWTRIAASKGEILLKYLYLILFL